MANQLVDSRGKEPDYMCGPFKETELRGINPVAREVGIIVNTEAVCKNDVLEATVLPNVFIL